MATKQIRTPADLAIHGAPPAFEAPLHVGRPNICNRDAFLARVGAILDNQWLTNNGPVVQEFVIHALGLHGDKIPSLYAPIKLLAPIAALFLLTSSGYYGQTFATQYQLINMSILLFSTSVITFLIVLISEQITNLTYRRDE